jgi:hypothetical protein
MFNAIEKWADDEYRSVNGQWSGLLIRLYAKPEGAINQNL